MPKTSVKFVIRKSLEYAFLNFMIEFFCLRIFMEEVKLIRMIPVRYDLFGVCREYTACVDFLRALSRDKGLDNRTHLS